jgi:hypothetical protein
MSSTLHTEIVGSRQLEAAGRELHARQAHEASVLACVGGSANRRRGVRALAVFAAVGLCTAIATTTSASAHASQHPARVSHAAAADHAKSHTVKFSGLIATLSSTGAAGVPGTTETDSGILDGTVSGRAVGRAAFYQTSTWGPGLTLAGGGRVFNPLGSIKFNATATWTVNANATESYTGNLEITGGTGFYRNAHGTAKVTGNAPAAGNSHAATISITGHITY